METKNSPQYEWSVTAKEAIEIQKEMRSKVILSSLTGEVIASLNLLCLK